MNANLNLSIQNPITKIESVVSVNPTASTTALMQWQMSIVSKNFEHFRFLASSTTQNQTHFNIETFMHL